MRRPEVKFIENQEEIINDNPNIASWEAEQLMRKYGYSNQNFTTNTTDDNGLTFEEMVSQHQDNQRAKGPKPTTFDINNGYNSQVKYESDSDTGFEFKIEIVSDMNIPKNY